MEINNPEAVAEVSAAFAKYEAALISNDVETLNALFLNSPGTIRFGAAENLFGYREIAAFRAARPAAGLERTITRLEIIAYGRDAAVTAIIFTRAHAPGKIGRQMQTWVRMPEGWRVAAAHVSIIEAPPSDTEG